MDNFESTSDKLKIERLSDLVKSLYENIDDLKSRLDEKNITQAGKAFVELFEKHWKLEENYNLNLSDLANREELIKESEEKYNRFANVHVKQRQEIKELKDSSLQQGHRFNNLTQEYNEKITTTMNERDYYKERVIASETKLSQAEETIASYKKTYETLRKENEELKLVVKYLNQHENVVFNDKHDFAYHIGNKMGELAKELEEANHLSLTMRTMYENLYDNYRDVKVELAEWKEYANELMCTKHNLHKTVGKLEKEKAILENNAAKHEKEIENLTAIISGMENELIKKDSDNDELCDVIRSASYILGNHNDYPRD